MQEGLTSVPNKDKVNGFGLGIWVARQKSAYIKGKLSSARIDAIESIHGLDWDKS